MKTTRTEPRTIREDVRDTENYNNWDHIGSGTQPKKLCRFAVRGMPCDCLSCVAAKEGREP